MGNWDSWGNVEYCLTFGGIGFDFDLIRNVCLCVFQCVYQEIGDDGIWEKIIWK